MNKRQLQAPFFEIGPKNYLFGEQIYDLAKIADAASQKYGIPVIYTTPYVNIEQVARRFKNLHVFAPHMDALLPGRGLSDILPEALRAAGAQGVMLNHCERPLSLGVLSKTLLRACAQKKSALPPLYALTRWRRRVPLPC